MGLRPLVIFKGSRTILAPSHPRPLLYLPPLPHLVHSFDFILIPFLPSPTFPSITDMITVPAFSGTRRMERQPRTNSVDRPVGESSARIVTSYRLAGVGLACSSTAESTGSVPNPRGGLNNLAFNKHFQVTGPSLSGG